MAITRRGIADRLPVALVPEQYSPTAILLGRNNALEARVIERVVFHMHGQAFLSRIQAGSLRDCPALQRAVQFQPKIVVQTARGVFLYDELKSAAMSDRLSPRFGGLFEIALLPILPKTHGFLYVRLGTGTVRDAF